MGSLDEKPREVHMGGFTKVVGGKTDYAPTLREGTALAFVEFREEVKEKLRQIEDNIKFLSKEIKALKVSKKKHKVVKEVE